MEDNIELSRLPNSNGPKASQPSGLGTVVHVVNDAASSVCIDDFDVEYDNALDILRTTQDRQNSGQTANHLSDFDVYNQRVAKQVILRERVQRRKRTAGLQQVRLSSKQYMNYFSPPAADAATGVGMSAGPASSFEGGSSGRPNAPDQTTASVAMGDTYTPSHTFDNFNGRRQNQSYNYQLNRINDPFTYEARNHPEAMDQVNELPDSQQPGNVEDVIAPSDEISFVTMDVDALESDDEDVFTDDEMDEMLSSPADVPYAPKLKRRLKSSHVQLMALGIGYGLGVLLDVSLVLFFTGPLGTLLGFLISGLSVLAALTSLGEMMSLVPSELSIPDLASRFVDKSFGFTIGICYWLCCVMALPAELTASAMIMTYFPQLAVPSSTIITWLTFFLVIVLLVSIMHVNIYGRIQFYGYLGTTCLMFMLFVVMLAINTGHLGHDKDQIGFRYWDYGKSDFENDYVYGPFRPQFFLEMSLDFDGEPVIKGIEGATGRFLQVIFAMTSAIFPYVGMEMVFLTAGEARNPRKSLPAATRKIFFKVVIFYILAVFLVSLNVYAGDGRLAGLATEMIEARHNSTVYAGVPGGCVTGHVAWNSYTGDSNSSPWIIAVQTVGECALAAGMNALLVPFGLLAGISYMHAASRTLYALAVRKQIPSIFARCSTGGVPYIAVTSSFAMSLLSYLVAYREATEVFAWFRSLATSAALIVYAGLCFSFIRFYRGLKLRQDITSSREKDELYPYKSPFQPYTAYFGLATNVLILILMGFYLFLREQWSTSSFLASYFCPGFAVVLYGTHRYFSKSKLVPLDRLDLDTGRKELERLGWVEDRVYARTVIDRLRNGFRGTKEVVKRGTDFVHAWAKGKVD